MNRSINKRTSNRRVLGINHASRRGSAMLLCFLAIAVLSVASIAIARSHRRLNIRQAVAQTSVQGRLAAEGLMHRQIAFQRGAVNTPPPVQNRVNRFVGQSSVPQTATANEFAPTDETLLKLPGMENVRGQLITVDTNNETLGLEITFYDGAPPIQRRAISYARNPSRANPSRANPSPASPSPGRQPPPTMVAVPARFDGNPVRSVRQ